MTRDGAASLERINSVQKSMTSRLEFGVNEFTQIPSDPFKLECFLFLFIGEPGLRARGVNASLRAAIQPAAQ